MPAWDPAQYLRYEDHRRRPALDLIGRIPPVEAGRVWDLGCGTGTITALLAERWPAARVTGLDSSPDMLERARSLPGIEWVLGDIGGWDPTDAADVVFSNAALHWLPDHAVLFPRLIDTLRPGGVLAVQMPRNFGEPSHTLLADLARSAPYTADIGHLVEPSPVHEPRWYHRLLRPRCTRLDVWETVYVQELTGSDPVAEWTRGSAARPYLEALAPTGRDEAFFAEYTAALRTAYPSGEDGTTPFPFRRLFVVAVR